MLHSTYWGSIWFDMFDCSLRVLVHAWIDVLTCPHSWSLLPSNVIDWVVVIAVASVTHRYPLHTSETSCECRCTFFLYSLHRTALPLVGAREHYLHCRRATSSEAYCYRVGTLSPHVAYIPYISIFIHL